jgi:hypothetical protein
MSGDRRRLLLGATAGLAALVIMTTVASAAGDGEPDVKLALRTDGGCGPFADSLPVLVSESGVAWGDTVADVTVCVSVLGAQGGSLVLQAEELVDVEVACTGDEALVDASCGDGRAGELSDSLIQQVGIGGCRRNPATKHAWSRPLSDLSTDPLLLAQRLKDDQLFCVRLILRYEPDADATVASQSDRTTWRYSFTLSGR